MARTKGAATAADVRIGEAPDLLFGEAVLDAATERDNKRDGRMPGNPTGGKPGWTLYSFCFAGMPAHQVRIQRERFRTGGLTPIVVNREVPFYPDDPAKNARFLADLEAVAADHADESGMPPTVPEVPMSEIWGASPRVAAKIWARRMKRSRADKHVLAYERSQRPSAGQAARLQTADARAMSAEAERDAALARLAELEGKATVAAP